MTPWSLDYSQLNGESNDSQAMKETNFSETSFPNDQGANDQGASARKSWSHRREERQHVSDCNSWREIGILMIWREMFRYIVIGRCVLISYSAVNHPYDYVSWYSACDEILYSARATFTRIHIKFRGTEAPPQRWKTRHVATSQPLMARWHDFKSIKVATNFISFWPLSYRFDQVPTKTSKQKQTDSKQWCEQSWFFKFLRGPLLVRIGNATSQKGHKNTFFDSSIRKVLWTSWYKSGV